jgi:hypothetical protein
VADDDNVAGNAVENAREALDEFFFSARVVPRRIPAGIRLFFLFLFFFQGPRAHTLFLRQSSVGMEKKASRALNREKHEVLNIFRAIVLARRQFRPSATFRCGRTTSKETETLTDLRARFTSLHMN